MELFALLKIQYSNSIGQVLYFVVPFLFGAGLLLIIREKNFVGIILSAMIIIVRYVITLIEVTIRHPGGPSAFEQTFFFFKVIGIYSMICAILGGILGVFLNKRVLKKA